MLEGKGLLDYTNLFSPNEYEKKKKLSKNNNKKEINYCKIFNN